MQQEQRATREGSADQENEEEFDNEEQSEPEPEPKPKPEPDCQFGVKIGGSPGKTAGLTQMRDLIRIDGEIQEFRFLSTEDGIIDLFRFTPCHILIRRCEQPDLMRSFDSADQCQKLPNNARTV